MKATRKHTPKISHQHHQQRSGSISMASIPGAGSLATSVEEVGSASDTGTEVGIDANTGRFFAGSVTGEAVVGSSSGFDEASVPDLGVRAVVRSAGDCDEEDDDGDGDWKKF